MPVIYPQGLTQGIQWVLAGIVLALSGAVYGRLTPGGVVAWP